MTAGQGRHGQFGPEPGARVRTPQERNAILDPAIDGRSKPGRPGRTVTDRDVRSLYLDLIRRDLTRYGIDELVPVRWPLRRSLLKTLNLMLVRKRPFDQRKRDSGQDHPADAETMIGMQRLTTLQRCVETVLADDIPGDLVECGVWRGGACILMRAVLKAYGDETRRVWVADSFAGVPPPDTANYQADEGIRFDRLAHILAVPEAEVRANFQRYGLLDDQVRFLPGWFKDTLHNAPIDRIALLKIDADLYESRYKRSTRSTRGCPPGVSASSMTTSSMMRVGKLSRTTARNMECPRSSLK